LGLRAAERTGFVRPRVTIDLRRALGGARRVLEVGIGVQYWYKIYGKPAGVVPGAKEPTPISSLTMHLPTGHSAD
jgi:hypothetical protein